MSLSAVRAAWRGLMPEQARRWAAPAVTEALRTYVRLGLPAAAAAQGPIRLVGVFDSPHGIGASARLARRALEALGAEVEAIDVTHGAARLPGPTPASAWIFHLNPPELTPVLAHLGPARILGPRYGYWAWELPRAPDRWQADAGRMDEVWAPSRFTAAAFASPARTRVVPHPLFLEDYTAVRPAERPAGFQAVTLFDFNSSMARKNPFGAITAFQAAFGDDPDCELVIKTHGGAHHPQALAELAARTPANMRLVDEAWPYGRVLEMISGADVLISLHRAEGFGLPMAEAMALGVPVVATAWSGNLDFMDETCAMMVPASLTPVDDPQRIYAGQDWAEPDLAQAVAALRRLRAEPALGRDLGDAGRRRVDERLSPQAWLASLPKKLRVVIAGGGDKSSAAR